MKLQLSEKTRSRFPGESKPEQEAREELVRTDQSFQEGRGGAIRQGYWTEGGAAFFLEET